MYSSIRIMSVVFVALLTLFHPAATHPAAAKAKTKTLTRTFSNPTAMTIPEDSPASVYPSTIGVSGFKQGKVRDVNITLRGLTHDFPGDIYVMLVAPNGRNALVMAEVGAGIDVADITITLDDQATQFFSYYDGLATGAYQPGFFFGDDDFPDPAPLPSGNERLATFNGIDPNGSWQLFVMDCCEGSSGALIGGWELHITGTTKVKKHKS